MSLLVDRRAASQVDWSYPDHFQQIAAFAAANDFFELQEADQLQVEMKAKRLLVGFTEGDLDYPPTSSRVPVATPGGVSGYNDDDLPKYADRILWHSQPGLAEWISQEWVYPLQQITTSSHVPLASVFRVQVNQHAARHTQHKHKHTAQRIARHSTQHNTAQWHAHSTRHSTGGIYLALRALWFRNHSLIRVPARRCSQVNHRPAEMYDMVVSLAAVELRCASNLHFGTPSPCAHL